MRETKTVEKLHSKVDMNIGKRGLTEEVFREIKKRLDKEGVIKVRINRNLYQREGIDMKTIAKRICDKTNSQVIDIRGRTIVISKNPKSSEAR